MVGLGNLVYFGVQDNHRMFRCGDYWGYYRNGVLVGVVAFFNNSQCMVYYTDDSVVRSMAEQIADNAVRIVLGCEVCVRPLVEPLRAMASRIAPRRQYFMEFRATEINRKAYEGMEFEQARPLCSSRAMQEFIQRCMKDGFGFSMRRSTIRHVLQERPADEHYLVLKAGRKYVAQAHLQAVTPGYAQIGGVCTLPEERNRGYGYIVISRMLALIEERLPSRRACLVVDDDNERARRLYEALGFRVTRELMLIDFL
jgi:ribosomal protein S18 acetylase RimI-like enzyme